jgi:hypothetical protein
MRGRSQHVLHVRDPQDGGEDMRRVWWIRPIAYAFLFGMGLALIAWSITTWTQDPGMLPLIRLFAGMFFVLQGLYKGFQG